ncbi:SDR family NAD(P)-dependent oxidoreductase [Amycolatopsis nigrescens]|uniref:SDR family NAD(P)-dependent oxidoreductase n=1 Tax=Amycolatopsis nigrescens TaxID=381445 RepID=UPI000360DB87|nr:SDR family oxidoreductase [Amycolatopsis nigrescens]
MTGFPSDSAARLAGKVAVITGGGTGIGAATARRFVAEGGDVVLVGRRESLLWTVAEELGGNAVIVPADVTDQSAVRDVVAVAAERFGGMDVVVANAGGHGLGAAGDLADVDWKLSLDANLTSTFVTVRECLPELKRRRGCVVVVSSIAGLAAGPEACGYVTAKHALIGLTRSLARDYGRHGVRVNALCPGWVRTPMADGEMDELAAAKGIDRAEAYALVTRHTPLGRPAEAAEIAAVIAFLASPDASFLTGSVVVADGGAGAVDLPTIAFDEDPQVSGRE